MIGGIEEMKEDHDNCTTAAPSPLESINNHNLIYLNNSFCYPSEASKYRDQ